MELAITAVRRRIPLAALAAAALAFAAPAQAQNAAPALDGKLLKPYSATYAVTAQGNPFGTNSATLAQEGDTWVVKAAFESDMFGQTMEIRVRSAGLAPISYKFAMSGGNTASADLTVAGGKLTGTADMPDQMGGKKTFDLAVPEGLLLPGMHRVALSILPLAVGQAIPLTELSMRSGTVENLTAKVTGEEKLTVAAGAFDTYRLDVTGSDQGSTLWVTKELPHLVVKQEMTMFPVVFELKTLQ